MALDLAVAHGEKGDDDGPPVDVVRDDGAVGGRVLPAQEAIKDSPKTATVDVRAAALDQGGRCQHDINLSNFSTLSTPSTFSTFTTLTLCKARGCVHMNMRDVR